MQPTVTRQCPLRRMLAARIAQNAQKKLRFDAFMATVLYHPQWGYYCRAGKKQLGPDGDFTTAPLISPLFGQCIATQCADILAIPSPDHRPTGILEIGAGTGALAIQILQALSLQQRVPHQYCILEISPALRRQQQQALKSALSTALFSRVKWLNQAQDCPTFSGVIIANEVADALPTRRIRKTQQGWEEAYVSHTDNVFSYDWSAVSDPAIKAKMDRYHTLLDPLPPGYITEMRTTYSDWMATLSQTLTSGVILLFDYGYAAKDYYHPERDTGTLRCYYQHQANDHPFDRMGEQDITAHVDFTDLAQAGQARGLSIAGWVTQAHFLINCELGAHMQTHLTQLAAHTPCPDQLALKQYAFSQAVQQLMLPAQMGEAVKVLGLIKPASPTASITLKGLAQYNRMHDLCRD